MKMYKCKVKGAVDADGCYTCFILNRDQREFSSRVLCKTAHITEILDVAEEMPMNEPVPVGEGLEG
jgi:hypothetical protein